MPEIKLDADKVKEFSEKLMESGDFRKKFAEDPRGTVKEFGMDVPEEMIPEKIDLEELEKKRAKAVGGVVGIIISVIV